MLLTTYPNTVVPKISERIAVIRSVVVFGVMSPYPTVVSVVNAQYLLLLVVVMCVCVCERERVSE